MTEIKFKMMIKKRIKENALKYLLNRRGSKGQGMKYSMLEMSEYLLPYNTKLNIEEKRRLFAMKNRMTLIPSNYGNSKEKCPCGTKENMLHIYTCEYLNEDKPKILYDELNNGKLKDQIDIFRRFENNMERRKYLTEKK